MFQMMDTTEAWRNRMLLILQRNWVIEERKSQNESFEPSWILDLYRFLIVLEVRIAVAQIHLFSGVECRKDFWEFFFFPFKFSWAEVIHDNTEYVKVSLTMNLYREWHIPSYYWFYLSLLRHLSCRSTSRRSCYCAQLFVFGKLQRY